MADRYQAWIEGAAAERPQLAAPLAELGELYHKKLWHQLTVKLEQLIQQPEFQEGAFMVALYQNFVSGFAHKINLLKLAFFAVAVGKQMATPEVSAASGTLIMMPGWPATRVHGVRVNAVCRPFCATSSLPMRSALDAQPPS